MVKNLPANAGDIRDAALIPGWEDALEEGMATHPSILARRIPWIEELGGHSCLEKSSALWLALAVNTL